MRRRTPHAVEGAGLLNFEVVDGMADISELPREHGLAFRTLLPGRCGVGVLCSSVPTSSEVTMQRETAVKNQF